jgi:cardiolipin synthase
MILRSLRATAGPLPLPRTPPPARRRASAFALGPPRVARHFAAQHDKASSAARRQDLEQDENWMNVPNALTMARMLATPGLAYLVLHDQYQAAIVGCFCAGILDYVDGKLAREWNQQTVLGSFLDPLADKVFIGTLLLALTYKSLFPWELAALIVGRDAVLLVGSFAYRFATKPADAKFFATSGQGVLHVTPSLLSRINTVGQMSVMGFALTRAAWGLPSDAVFLAMSWGVAFTTMGSGLGYANMKNLRSSNAAK